MILAYKDIAPNNSNGNNTVKGGWLFEKMDYAALTVISESFYHRYPNLRAVTSSADVKYKNPVHPHDYIEIWSEIKEVTSAQVSVGIVLKTRKRYGAEWIVATTGNFNFVFVDSETKKLSRIPREVINETKG